MSDRDLGYIKGTLDALLVSHNELKVKLDAMVTNNDRVIDDMEKRVDAIESKLTWIYAWSAGAAFVVSVIAYLLFNIWNNIR